MNRRVILFFCILLLVSGLLFTQQAEFKKVLVLHSYHLGYEWTDDINKAISETLNTDKNIELTIEFMDLLRNPSEEYLIKFEEILLLKYKERNINFDVIVVSDDPAFNFLLKTRDKLFKGIPIVFCGINDFTPERIKGHKAITGINESISIKETVDIALKLRPKARKMAVISCSSHTARKNLEIFSQIAADYQDKVEIVYLSELEPPGLQSNLKTLSEEDIILYLSYLQMPSGKKFTVKESVNLIREASAAPIFGCWDFLIPQGAIGGKVVHGISQGKAAAEIALQILKGGRADKIPFIMESPNQYVFDDVLIEYYDIPEKMLPPNSIILNQTASHLTRNWDSFTKNNFFSYKIFQEHGTIMMLVDPKTGVILDANMAARNFYNYPKLNGKNIKEINTLSPEEVQVEMEKAQKLSQNHFNFKHRLADGTTRDVEVYGYPVEINNTKVLFSVIIDVTEKLNAQKSLVTRNKWIFFFIMTGLLSLFVSVLVLLKNMRRRKIFETTLRESESRLKSVVESSPLGMHFYKLNETDQLIFIGANHAADKILGVDNSLFVNKTIEEAFPPLAETIIPDKYKNIAHNGGIFENEQIEYKDSFINGAFEIVAFQIAPRQMVTMFFDITERKIAQEGIQRREEEFRAIFNSTSEAIFIDDASNGNMINANERAIEMYGYNSVEDILSGNIGDISANIPPYTEEKAQEYIFKAIKGEPQTFDWLAKKKNGDVFWVEVSLKFSNLAGKDSVIAVIRDISERKQAEETLKESEEKFRLIAENTGDIITVMDMNLNITYESPAVFSLRGFTVEESMIQSMGDIFTPASLKIVMDTFNKQLENGFRDFNPPQGAVLFTELEEYCKDGSTIWVEISTSLIRDVNDNPVAFVSITRDITARKKAQDDLRESENKYRSLIDFAVDGIILSSPSGQILEVNSCMCKITGLSREGILGKNINDALFFGKHNNKISLGFDLLSPTDALFFGKHNNKISLGFDLLSPTDTIIREFCLHTTDGFDIIIEMHTKMMPDGNFQSIIRDITDRKKAEEELQKISKLRSLGILSGGIAHDFNNILTGLYGNISLAKGDLNKDHPSFEALEDAEKSMTRAIRLTKQLLTFAKGGDPVKEDVSLGKLVEEVVRFDLSGSNILPVFDEVPDLWLAEVDKGQMQQVISNLTINAKQAMPNGGHIFISLANADINENSLGGLKKGKYLKLTVKDEGMGIDQSHLDRIFDPYFSTKQTGSGLGLATCYSVMTRHGGQISVTSELGKGSCFTLYIPASEKRKTQTDVSFSQTFQHIRKKHRILLMDDEEMIRSLVVKMLSKTGDLVDTAVEGKIAVEMYKKAYDDGNPYDFLIMDLTIPGGVGGEKAIKEILKINPDAKAIVSSGYAEDPVMARYTDYGFKGIIAKPYTASALEVAINKITT